MPHESTVNQENPVEESLNFEEQANIAPRWRDSDENTAVKRARLHNSDSLVPHLRAETPKKITHHDDDSDDEGSSSSSSSFTEKNGVAPKI